MATKRLTPEQFELQKAEWEILYQTPGYRMLQEASAWLNGRGEGKDEDDFDGEDAASDGRLIHLILLSGHTLGPFEEHIGDSLHGVYLRHKDMVLEEGEHWGEYHSHVVRYDQIAAVRIEYPAA